MNRFIATEKAIGSDKHFRVAMHNSGSEGIRARKNVFSTSEHVKIIMVVTRKGNKGSKQCFTA